MKKNEWEDNQKLLAAKAKLNPCIRGWPGKKLYDLDFNQIELSDLGFELLKAIEKNPGMSIGALPVDLEKSLIASTAKYLKEKLLLLIYPL